MIPPLTSADARRRTTTSMRRSPNRPGLTLVEVIVAMMILVGVLFALGGFTMKYAQASAQARLTITANELAARRLDAVRTQPSYSAIALLAGTMAAKADYTTYSMTTSVRRVGGAPTDSVDYQLVTVMVTHPAMRKPVAKTTAIAAY